MGALMLTIVVLSLVGSVKYPGSLWFLAVVGAISLVGGIIAIVVKNR